MVSLQNVQIIHKKTLILIAIYVISVLRHFCLISVIINNNSTFFRAAGLVGPVVVVQHLQHPHPGLHLVLRGRGHLIGTLTQAYVHIHGETGGNESDITGKEATSTGINYRGGEYESFELL